MNRPELRTYDADVSATIERGDILIKASRLDERWWPLVTWWVAQGLDDLGESGIPKTDEYGAHDLEVMGRTLALLAWQSDAGLPVAMEIAVWFYVLGKVSRLLSDYMAQRAGRPDTWHDITVYSMMARRIQETGRWP
jgi:hypothetical protein